MRENERGDAGAPPLRLTLLLLVAFFSLGSGDRNDGLAAVFAAARADDVRRLWLAAGRTGRQGGRREEVVRAAAMCAAGREFALRQWTHDSILLACPGIVGRVCDIKHAPRRRAAFRCISGIEFYQTFRRAGVRQKKGRKEGTDIPSFFLSSVAFAVRESVGRLRSTVLIAWDLTLQQPWSGPMAWRGEAHRAKMGQIWAHGGQDEQHTTSRGHFVVGGGA